MAARIVFVTGKGGVGKSSIATALAEEAALRRTPCLLVRMPASAGAAAARLFPARGASLLQEAVLDPARDLESFLTRILGFGFIARRLRESRTFAAVAAAAPGLRDLVALATISAEASRRRGLVVFDAPASGHSVPMLTAPARVLDLTPLGPVAREARRAATLISDPASFAAVLVTTPEELAITEVLSLREQVAAAGVRAVHVVINAVWPAYLSEEEGRTLASSGASEDATRHVVRSTRQAELIAALEARAGSGSRIGFCFHEAKLPQHDVARLYDLAARRGQ